jgi:hypothetical protein
MLVYIVRRKARYSAEVLGTKYIKMLAVQKFSARAKIPSLACHQALQIRTTTTRIYNRASIPNPQDLSRRSTTSLLRKYFASDNKAERMS